MIFDSDERLEEVDNLPVSKSVGSKDENQEGIYTVKKGDILTKLS